MKYLPVIIGLLLAIPVYLVLNQRINAEKHLKHDFSTEVQHKIAHYWAEFAPNKALAISYRSQGTWRGDTAFVLRFAQGLAYKFESKKDTINFCQRKKITANTYQISIYSMLQGSYKAFMNEMEAAAGKTGFDTLILDLSHCGAGSMSEAIKITNQLIFTKGINLATFNYNNGEENKITSTGDIFFPVSKIIIHRSSVMCPEANLITDMLGAHGSAKIEGTQDENGHRIYDLYPIGKEYFVFIPVGSYSVK